MVTVIFLLFNVLPDDPARMMLDQREDSTQLENIRKKYGFDKPITAQYVYYLNDLSPISIHSKNEDDFTFCDIEELDLCDQQAIESYFEKIYKFF